MTILKAALCKLGRHKWVLWMADTPMTIQLEYVCSRCNTRRRT